MTDSNVIDLPLPTATRMTDRELHECVGKLPTGMLVTVAFNSLRVTMEGNFDASTHEQDRNACIVAMFCMEYLFKAPGIPDAEETDIALSRLRAAYAAAAE